MPECGSQIFLCDLPIRFDTYRGCTHKCAYCFVSKKVDLGNVRPHESVKALRNFVEGGRTRETAWCDWDIPLHWGGVSDPFQPAERALGRSMECLKLLAETGYPFVFSTKGGLIGSPPYLGVLRDCNAVAQVSMVSAQYDNLEPGAPSFDERLGLLSKLADVTRRVIVRVQPYALGLLDDVLDSLPKYHAAGVYGVTIEGMKRCTKRDGWVKVGGDWCYPAESLQSDYEEIRRSCHELGLAFFCAENRLRFMGDDPCCCGVAGLDGFRVNIANLNHLGPDEVIRYTDRMREPEETGGPFRALVQATLAGEWVERGSYAGMMELVKRSKPYRHVMGLRA